MADLSVKMSLTLADAASGPLRGFIQQVEQLRAVANAAMKPLEGIAAGIAGINRVASQPGLRSFTGQVEGMAAAAGVARGNTVGLEAAIGALSATINGLTGRLAATAAGLSLVGTGARAAGAGVTAGAAAMGTGLATANTQAGTLMQTLKGLGQLYAAMKIKEGLVASAEGAIDYEKSRTRAANMGMTAAEQNTLIQSARNTISQVPQLDRGQALEMAIDLKNFMNSVEGAAAILPQMARLKVNLDAAGLKVDKNVFVDVGKLLQQRDAISGPRLDENVDMIGRIVAYTQGRVDVAKLTQSIQAMRATGQTVEAEFLPVLASMIEMSGGRNVQGATLRAAERYVMGNVKNGLSAKEAARLGLLEQEPEWNSLGNINLKKSELRMKGAELWQRNPFEWVQQFLLPALASKGITESPDILRSVNRMFPTALAGDAISTMATQGRILQGDIAGVSRVLPQQQQFNNNMQTAAQRIEAVKGQLRDLGIVLGETFLPAIKKVADTLVPAFQGLASFFESNPVAATIATWTAAIAGIVLAVAGMANLFGVVLRPLAALWTPISTAVGFLGTAMSNLWAFAAPMLTSFGTAVAGFASTVGAVLLRAIPVIGTFFAAWSFTDWLVNSTAFGEQLKFWATNLIEWVVDAFRTGWRAIGNIITSIIPSAQAAQGTGLAGPSGERRGTMPRTGLASLRDTGAGGGRGMVNPPLVDATGAPIDPEVARLLQRGQIGIGRVTPNFDAAESPGSTGRGRGGRTPSAAAQLRERFAFSAITDSNESYKADFLRGEKGAYTASPVTTGKTPAELDAIELQVKRDLLQTAGQRRAAEAQRIKDELDGNLALLVTSGRITQAEADLASARAQAAVELRKQQTDTAVAQETYRRQLIEIDAAERSGMISDLEAATRRQAVRKAEAAQLNELLAKELALAEARGDKEGAEKIRTAMAGNVATLGELSPEMTQVLGATRRGFEGFFSGIMNGTKSVKQAFKDLGNSIFQSINDIISKKLADQLFNSLFGGSGMLGTPSGGGGTGIFGWLGGLFGGGSPGGAQGNLGNSIGLPPGWMNFMGGGGGGGMFGWLGSLFGGGGGAQAIPWVLGFADGTDYVPRDMLAYIHEGERITPKAYNPAAGFSGGPGISQRNQFVFQMPVTRETAGHISARLARDTQREVSRGTSSGSRR